MDKRGSVYRKKVFCYGGFLILLVLLCVLASADLIHRRKYSQSEFESALPQKPRKDINEKIRVLIKTKGFAQTTHTEVTLQATSGLKIISGETIVECEPGQSITITPNGVKTIESSFISKYFFVMSRLIFSLIFLLHSFTSILL